MTEQQVTVQLVNLDPVEARTVIVQGGAYAEHQLTRVRTEPISGAAEQSQELLGRAGRPAGSRADRGTGVRLGPGAPAAPGEGAPPIDVRLDGAHFAVRLAPGA